jgi:hypothetical protein
MITTTGTESKKGKGDDESLGSSFSLSLFYQERRRVIYK